MNRKKRKRRLREWAAFYSHMVYKLGPTLTNANRCCECGGALLDGYSPSTIVHKPECAGVERMLTITRAFDSFKGDFL